MEMYITRKGEFAITNPVENLNKCGPLGYCHYNYEVKIGGVNVHLKVPQRFIIAHQYIHDYFADRYAKPAKVECVSCETMAEEAVRFFHILFRYDPEYRDTNVDFIRVRISGATDAAIDAIWRKETE